MLFLNIGIDLFCRYIFPYVFTANKLILLIYNAFIQHILTQSNKYGASSRCDLSN